MTHTSPESLAKPSGYMRNMQQVAYNKQPNAMA